MDGGPGRQGLRKQVQPTCLTGTWRCTFGRGGGGSVIAVAFIVLLLVIVIVIVIVIVVIIIIIVIVIIIVAALSIHRELNSDVTPVLRREVVHVLHKAHDGALFAGSPSNITTHPTSHITSHTSIGHITSHTSPGKTETGAMEGEVAAEE